MAIGSAIQKSGLIQVFNERGALLCTLFPGTDGILQGYTGTTISVRKGNVTRIYNERGNPISTVFA